MNNYDWKTVRVNGDQSYEWQAVESKFGKIKKYAEIKYYFYGSVWRKVATMMKNASMPAHSIGFYKGAQIDVVSSTVRLRGHFVHDMVKDKHMAFWRAFFDGNPNFNVIGKIIKLPNIAGDSDSLNYFIDGENVGLILNDPQEESAHA